MYVNRDEFLLLSRRGSVPPSSGAGPPRPFGEPGTGYRPARGRRGSGARRGGDGALRLHRVVAALRRRGRSAGARAAGVPAPSWPERGAGLRPERGAGLRPEQAPPLVLAHGYADPEAYLELEFAVGFGAEDELWL